MIQYVKRNKIDVQKYDTCIEQSINSRIYAYSWYLDIVADNWDVLILNDYEAVMPLPWRQKYFIKYIYPPAWTQQLGVFSPKDTPEELIHLFIKKIPKKFKKVTIQFNSGNVFQYKKCTERVNYILPLNKSYEEIYKDFNNNRKRDLRKAEGLNIVIDKNVNCKTFIKQYIECQKNYKLHPSQLEVLTRLIKSNNSNINLWGVFKNNILITSLFTLKDKNRITYLLPFANSEARKNGVPTLIISELIKQFSISKLQIDFEGSMINGVAGFYKSFGSKLESYKLLQKNIIY